MPGALSIRSRAVGAIRRLQCLSSLYGEIHGEVDEGKREKGRGFGILSLFIRLPDVALQLKNWKLLSFKRRWRRIESRDTAPSTLEERVTPTNISALDTLFNPYLNNARRRHPRDHARRLPRTTHSSPTPSPHSVIRSPYVVNAIPTPPHPRLSTPQLLRTAVASFSHIISVAQSGTFRTSLSLRRLSPRQQLKAAETVDLAGMWVRRWGVGRRFRTFGRTACQGVGAAGCGY